MARTIPGTVKKPAPISTKVMKNKQTKKISSGKQPKRKYQQPVRKVIVPKVDEAAEAADRKMLNQNESCLNLYAVDLFLRNHGKFKDIYADFPQEILLYQLAYTFFKKEFSCPIDVPQYLNDPITNPILRPKFISHNEILLVKFCQFLSCFMGVLMDYWPKSKNIWPLFFLGPQMREVFLKCCQPEIIDYDFDNDENETNKLDKITLACSPSSNSSNSTELDEGETLSDSSIEINTAMGIGEETGMVFFERAQQTSQTQKDQMQQIQQTKQVNQKKPTKQTLPINQITQVEQEQPANKPPAKKPKYSPKKNLGKGKKDLKKPVEHDSEQLDSEDENAINFE